MRPAVLGLVADDLTGAGDAAAGLAEAGWHAVLALDTGSPPAPDPARPTVLAVSTASRALAEAAAADRTARAVEALLAAGAERLYVKVDSTVRGSVAGQVAGALRAWAHRLPGARAVVCPAFPSQGRTVVAGEVLVAGAPLAGSAAADDPVTPRTDGGLVRLLPGAVGAPDDLSGPPGSRLVVDATDDVDLDRLAGRLDAAGGEVVAVGSGGLAAALGRLWSFPRPAAVRPLARGRVLVAVSSRHPTSAGQLAWLRAGALVPDVDVLTTPPAPSTPDAAAAALADQVAHALAEHHHGALVLVGGDGAAAVLARLGADRVDVDGAVLPGCPTGVVGGGAADGLRLATKSGGFGSPDALHRVVDALRTPVAPPAAPAALRPPSPPTPEEVP